MSKPIVPALGTLSSAYAAHPGAFAPGKPASSPAAFRRRAGQQGGNAMIETSLILVPLLAMFFGIGNVCLLLFIKGAFQNATRTAVRWAITYSTTYNGQACATQTACIKQIVQDNAFGFLNGAQGASLITVNYYAPFNLSSPITSVPITSTDPNFPNVSYFNQSGNVVEVVIAGYQWNWMAPIAGFLPQTATTLGASSADVLEGYPVGATSPPPY
jgi:Flp pilus assembly protein TadG